MRNRSLVSLLLVLLVAGCSFAASEKPEEATEESVEVNEPDHIKVQHILISFEGKLSGKNITRTAEEAKKLAFDLMERAKKGEDFDALVKEHTDDSHPGIYGMVNKGVTAAQGESPRGRMVAAFGNVGFKLKVGDIGMANYDPAESPFGYHIIKRIE